MKLLTVVLLAAGLRAQALEFEVAAIRPTDEAAATVQAGVQITQGQVRAVGLPLRSYTAVG